jgi:phosphoribosyl 1,2-cyclic phosphodiesterase
VVHSIRAPAVGFRIDEGRRAIFYVPDVLEIPDRRGGLRGIAVYVGDGATIARPIVRGSGRARVGHASISQQLDWCAAEGVRRAIFTHCGSAIVSGDERAARDRIRGLGLQSGVRASVARDGWRCEV